MSIQIEAIEGAINFNSAQGAKLERVDLGPVGEGKRLVHGLFRHALRAVTLPGQPRVFGETTQPIWAIVDDKIGPARGEIVTALAYSADVLELGDSLASQVVERINIARDSLPIA